MIDADDGRDRLSISSECLPSKPIDYHGYINKQLDHTNGIYIHHNDPIAKSADPDPATLPPADE